MCMLTPVPMVSKVAHSENVTSAEQLSINYGHLCTAIVGYYLPSPKVIVWNWLDALLLVFFKCLRFFPPFPPSPPLTALSSSSMVPVNKHTLYVHTGCICCMVSNKLRHKVQQVHVYKYLILNMPMQCNLLCYFYFWVTSITTSNVTLESTLSRM